MVPFPPAKVVSASAKTPDLPVAADYRLAPLPLGSDFVISRALLDLVLLHLLGPEVTDEQRRTLAEEMCTLAGLHL